MLRVASQEDFDLIVKLSKKFISTTKYSSYVDENVLYNLINNFLSSPKETKIILLYDDVGMLAGQITPFIFGNHLVASEQGWWVEPGERNKNVGKELLNAFEYWAKKQGCSLITMISLDDTVGKHLEKKGYYLSERTYVKEI